MTDRDRPTPPDAHRVAKPPRPAQDAPGSRDPLDDQRRVQHAKDSLQRTGARLTGPDRGQLEQRRETPKGLPVPSKATLHDGAPPPSSAGPVRSQSPAEGQAAVLLDELGKARTRIAELERDARAAAEVKVASFPPPVQPQRHPSPAPSSVQQADLPISDAAIGRGVRHLLKRFWPLLVGSAGLGAGGVGIAKPAADPAKADATASELMALKRDHALVVEQLTGVLKRDAERDRYLDCLTGDYDEAFGMLLPAPDRMGSARTPKPWVARCAALKPSKP